ncbi:MAG TPA: alpha/beta hydrolase [Candidatus Binataceae bacterium]|nr:alpha/beta hydrolase [Candidatus Binataceae bacterium]
MRIQIGDVQLFFDVEGTKLRPHGSVMREVPTILLLHGGPGFDHSGFKPDFAQLTDVVQVVYLDHRGSGRSDRGAVHRWKLEQWADDICAFCDALGIRQPIVMGQSFGGCVALAYAIRHPDHPSKIIVSSALVRPIGQRCFAMFERLGGAAARESAIAFWTNPGPSTRGDYFAHCMPLYTRRKMPEEFFARSVRNPDVADYFFGGELKTLDLLPHLSSIRCPTLVTGGEEDPVTTINDAEEIAAAIPSDLVRFERFPDAGHGVYRDQPDRFFRILREFIAS